MALGECFLSTLFSPARSQKQTPYFWTTDNVECRDGRDRNFTSRLCDKSVPGPSWHHNTDSKNLDNNKMAARCVFSRKTLTSSLYCPKNRLRMNDLNCVRCLSLSRGTKGSKPGSSKEENIYDVAIVGGGAMGSSSAYFLANRMSREMGKICVIERDPTVSK